MQRAGAEQQCTISHKECLREADAVWSNAESICGDECRIKVMKFLPSFLRRAQVSQTEPAFIQLSRAGVHFLFFLSQPLRAVCLGKDQ